MQIWAGAQPPSNWKPGTLQEVPLSSFFCSAALPCNVISSEPVQECFYVSKRENYKLDLSGARMPDDSHLLACGKVCGLKLRDQSMEKGLQNW